ncbi:Sec-independent protein translocase protein TatB [Pseudooceanicola sp. CBS1P-1]|uniref:Sec-independent protein translocase protein TatB n=1 Tax=Pseudooceanicola albus TaxID=2692189 RepID=A0A6L7FZ68_9RHOB|nr:MULTISPECIES: Sec-independent protein translocase protein TatB [Pseudooceanicola]MBT9382504.1 Sec-independent protein translocase protein TatB [Pseudooceanicola endophyticus]MXN17045.1 twin-arginine translocase subunit TatB [Pseudooceanicola albus]
MFGMGWTEILLIGIVALIVVGPKELPNLFRTVGQFVGKARGMAREFTRAMEDAADQSGMKETNQMLKGMANPKKFGLDKVKEAADSVTRPMTPAPSSTSTSSAAMTAERTETAKKIQEATAQAATNRLEAEAAKDAEQAADEVESALAVPDVKLPPKAAATPAAPAPQPAPQPQAGLHQTAAQRASGGRAAKPAAKGRAARSSRLPSRKN